VTLRDVRRRLAEVSDPDRAAGALRYFKSVGSDKFRGVAAPDLRRIARELRALDADVIEQLLASGWHEERALALLILVDRYQREPDAVHALYLANLQHIDNWDLVDLSAEHIIGAHGDRRLIRKLAKSKSLWERRIAVLATRHFLKRGDFSETLRIAAALLQDEEDLIHKAVGWMLREIGDRDLAAERAFLDEHVAEMPRTMLRYAIEKFPPELRRGYLART
jgi:3-methyladenine DNA glycosylase AlkD